MSRNSSMPRLVFMRIFLAAKNGEYGIRFWRRGVSLASLLCFVSVACSLSGSFAQETNQRNPAPQTPPAGSQPTLIPGPETAAAVDNKASKPGDDKDDRTTRRMRRKICCAAFWSAAPLSRHPSRFQARPSAPGSRRLLGTSSRSIRIRMTRFRRHPSSAEPD